MTSARMPSLIALLACGAAITTLSACGSDTAADSAASSSTSRSVAPAASSETAAPAPLSACPITPPAAGGAAEWTLPGTTGSVSVTGSTDTAAPRVEVSGPFGVTETQVHTLKPGTGPVVSDTATVSVCYMGVNGRDGSVFDSSYERGEPAQFPLDGVVPGFKKAIAGQHVGSTVGVAMTSADGYPNGQPSAGIRPGDTLVFAIKILDAAN